MTRFFFIERKISDDSKKGVFIEKVAEAKKWVKNVETLDVGGGDGLFISKVINPNKITVVDLNKNALDKNPSKTKIFGNISNLPKNLYNRFRQVTLFEVIEHIKESENRKKIFEEIHKSLKKGGRLIMSTPNRDRLSSLIRKIIFKPRKYPYPVAGYSPIAGMRGNTYIDYHYFEYNSGELKKELERIGFRKVHTYSKFIQVPYISLFFGFKSNLGSTLYTIAQK